jgi:hypothetical protein
VNDIILPYIVYDSRYYTSSTPHHYGINNASILVDKDLDKYIKDTTITEDSDIIVKNIKDWMIRFDIDSIGFDNFLALTELIEEDKWKKKLYQVSTLNNRNCVICFGQSGDVILCRVNSNDYRQTNYLSLFEFMNRLEQEGSMRIFIEIEKQMPTLTWRS